MSCPTAGDILCGVRCLPKTRCCLSDVGWSCASGDACYTVSSTIGCRYIQSPEPTYARSCIPSGVVLPPDDDSYVYCNYPDAQFCGQSVYLNTDATTFTSDFCTTSPVRYTTDVRPRVTAGSTSATATTLQTSRSTPTAAGATTVPVTTPQAHPAEGLSAGAIAGIVVGAIFGFFLLIVLLAMANKKKDTKPTIQATGGATVNYNNNGAHNNQGGERRPPTVSPVHDNPPGRD